MSKKLIKWNNSSKYLFAKIFSILIIFNLLFLSFGVEPQKASAAGQVITIDTASSRRQISPYIYGLNFAKPSFANEIDLPVRRWGGNGTSRYNWQTNHSNTANDWYYENTSVTNAYDWNTPETYDQWIGQNVSTGTDSIITIPMIGYAAKDATSCGFSITKYGPQTGMDDPWRIDCGNGVNNNGNVTSNDPLDTSIVVGAPFMQAWVDDMVNTYGSAGNGGVRFYALDNEPELWSETHRDIHPIHQSYDELLAKTILYGEAIKTADPGAATLGFVSFGWSGYWYSRHDMAAAEANGYTYFPDYATHGNLYQVEWYLAQMQNYETAHGSRLLDYLDLHYYPENGVALQTAGNAAMQALRLRSTRALWDPTYRDESWIGGDDQAPDQRYVRLIPRMHNWVNTYYPGTKLAITEYNFGGLEHINGALTQAEVLGVFGREGLDLATLWNYPNPSSDPLGYIHFEDLPGAYAFRMYRNYDGIGGKFGDTSVSASGYDPAQVSIFAAERSADGALTIMAINKTAGSVSSTIALQNFIPASQANVFFYSAENLTGILQQPNLWMEPAGFTYTFAPNSITLIVIPKGDNATTYTKIIKSKGSQDGWILESSETSNTGGSFNDLSNTLQLGDDGADRQYRAILHFDTSALPDNAVIQQIRLKIKKQGITGSDPFLLLGPLQVDMRKPSFGMSALTLSDFNLTAGRTHTASFAALPVNNWYSASLNNRGKIYINRAGTTQFRLYFAKDDNDNNSADLIRLFSGDAPAASRPQLIIEYDLP